MNCPGAVGSSSRWSLLFCAVFGMSGCALGGGERVFDYRERGGGEVKMRYLVSLPDGFDPEEDKLPLLLFLHGSGERGQDIERVKAHGPPKLVGELPVLSRFVVVSPQCPSGGRWDTRLLRGLLDDVTDRYRIDEKRMYLTGLSLGGYGAWEMAMRYPGLFAAVVPVCGGGKVEAAPRLVETPVWVFHGELDSAVPVARSTEMVDAIRAAGGNQVKLTVFEGVGHDSWTKAYGNPELYTWLLTHKTGE